MRQIKTNQKQMIYNKQQTTRWQWDNRQQNSEVMKDNKTAKWRKMMKWQSDKRQWNDEATKDFKWNMTNNKIQWISKTLWHDEHDRWQDKNCDKMIDNEQ